MSVALAIWTPALAAGAGAVAFFAAFRIWAMLVRHRKDGRKHPQPEGIMARLPVALYQSEVGEHGRWRYVSPRIEAMLGYPAERWLADPELWVSLIHPDDRERALHDEYAIWGRGRGSSGGFEYRMFTIEGETIWIRDEFVVRDDGYLDGMLSDVTDLRRAEERFELLLEAAPDPMVIVDESGTIMRINRALTTVLGYRREEILGKPVEILVPEEVRNRHGGHRAGYAHAPRSRPMGTGLDLNVRRKDGSLLPVEISLSPISSEDGGLVIAAIRDATTQREAERTLRHLAEHDPLTGLHNRRRFEQELRRTIAAADRYRTPAAVLAIDVDRFKEVNDLLGHAAGDEMLVKIASVLRGRLRETDVLARLGGDELAAIVTHAGPEEVRTVAEGLLETVRREARLEAWPKLRMTITVGAALIEPGCTSPGERILAHADSALYRAKQAGRDTFCVFDEALSRPTQPSGGDRAGAPRLSA